MSSYRQPAPNIHLGNNKSAVGGGSLIQEINDSLAQRVNKNSSHDQLLSKEYEKIMQKLEADIRGHIRLEHEMKIHLDYLEGRVEELENTNLKLSNDKKQGAKKVASIEDKLKSLNSEKERELEKVKLDLQKALEQLQVNDRKYREQIDKLTRDLDLLRAQTIIH